MTRANRHEPILIDLDQQAWKDQIDRVESWLGNVLMTQTAFKGLIENTIPKIEEPHIKEYLQGILETAKKHQQQAEQLYRVIGREPSSARKLAAPLLSSITQTLTKTTAAAGGAVGGWQDLRTLLLVNLDAMSAFAVAEQLGLALGIAEIEDMTFPIINEKTAQQLLLQEYLLEMGPVSILYHMHT
jgi:hypothetical protein